MISLRCLFLSVLAATSAAAETDIHIVGLQDRSENQILGLMGARLEHVRSHPASASRADDAAFLVTQILHKDGYAAVQVSYKIVSNSSILLTVNAGERLSLADVKITGVAPADEKRFAKLYSRPAEKDRPLGAGEPPFREHDVETGLSYIEQELNAEGFWDADAKVTDRQTDPKTGDVHLTINVAQGTAYKIGAAGFESSDGRGLDEARTAAAPFAGMPATTGNINGMRLAVEEAFHSRGYPDAKISMGRTLDSARFVPNFFIDLGKRVQLRTIRLDGLERTRPGALTKRLKTLEGDWYDEAAMNKRIRGLLSTGAFSSIRVEKTEVGENTIDATLHFEEAKAREFSAGIGVDSYEGVFLRTTYADRNLDGRLLGLRTGFEISTLGVLGEASITDPWWFGTEISASGRIYALIYAREGYQSLETGIEGKLSRKFGDHYTLEVLAGYSIVNLSSDGLPSSVLGETLYTHPRLRITQSVDFRDNPILPTKGWHVENPFEIGAAVGDASTAYVQSSLSGGWYRAINAKYSVALGGHVGFIIPTGDGTDFPIDMRLFNGGAHSVRSFPERELGPTVNGYPTGGEASWNANVEFLRKLSGSVSAVAFVDAGSLSRSFDEIASSDMELAAGLGVRLDLPIGPVRLEYGYNLTRDPGEPVGTLHFAIGITF